MKKVWMIIFLAVVSASAMAQQIAGTSVENQQFILIFRFKADAPPPTAAQMKASKEKWGEWMGGLAGQGKLAGGEQIGFGGTTITGIKKKLPINQWYLTTSW